MNIKNLYHPNSELQLSKDCYKTRIEGLLYCAHSTHEDNRGFFSELGSMTALEKVINNPFPIKQISHARSNKNVIRGFHGENWAKYVQVVSGKCFSAIADVRPESATFLNVEIFILGQGEGTLDGSLYIPPRLGNSMCVLDGPVDYIYLFNELYSLRDVSGDVAISLFDKDLGVEWPISKEEMIISERDQSSVMLREKYPEAFQK